MDNPFEGMTNGEVIQALFPNTTFKDAFIDTFAEITFAGSGYALLKKEWLNQEYNGSFAVPEREKGYRYMFDNYDDAWGDIVLPN